MEPIILDPTQDPDQDHFTQTLPQHQYYTKGPSCFHKEVDASGICWLTFDTPDVSANVWSPTTLDQLDVHIEELHRDSSVRALVLRSAKEKVFIAGADLKMLVTLPEEKMKELLVLGQDVFNHLESLRIPKVAAIHGACAGGGFEMALACDWRIASDDPSTRIGLPETQLGLIPAWGGSTRLPRLIGVPKALDLIVRGKLVKARQALRLGLVHEVTAREHLDALARKLALRTTHVKSHHFMFSQIWPVPQLIGVKTRMTLSGKYPWMASGDPPAAQMVALDVITRGASRGFDASLRLEQDAMLSLAMSPSTRRFIQTFFRKEAASKKLPPSLEGNSVRPIKNVTVVGAGVMGSGIAYTLAGRGSRVQVRDNGMDALSSGVSRVRKLLNDGVKHHAFTQGGAREVHDRLSFTNEKPPLRHMDIIIEAIVESLDAKKALFQELAAACSDETLLATNTSALSVAEIAHGVPHPERVLGLHFFNPAHLMPLVEVVSHPGSSPDVLATAVRYVQSLGKTPIVVKDSPGFVVNRILMPYLMGAVEMAETMRDPWDLDDAMLNFGMPMGPLRLLDEIGFDVALHVESTLRKAFGNLIPQTTLLRQMVEQGMLGQKNGRGFYRAHHEASGPQPNPEILKMLEPKASAQASLKVISDRLNSLMQHEAYRCLEEGIVSNAADIELAMTLGTGYPPFRELVP